MPQNLCPNCAQAVRSFTEFREKSILSETTLREVIQVIKLCHMKTIKYVKNEKNLSS